MPSVKPESRATVAQQLGFRLDIQGLRAVAVVAVVAFHIGLPVAGYIGVDVFFVISGFVITNLLLREVERNGRVRLGRFWSRRFVRLMPALSLVVVAVVLVSALLLLPPQQEVANLTGLAAMFFVANVFIARTTGGYFDPPADGNPLLNTWSLSVEEQFYFVFPVVVLLATLAKGVWTQRARIAMVVLAVTGVSFVLMMMRYSGVLNVTWLNFYDPIQRAWEFGVGSLLAFAPMHRLAGRKLLGRLLAVLGVSLLVLSLVALQHPSTYPGPLTLLPVASAVCLITAGTVGSHMLNRILSSRPFVTIGDGSYSIYLWHWPAVSFALLLGAESTWVLGGAVLVSMLPAWMSYRWVETPLRVRMHHSGRVNWSVPVATWGVPVVVVAALTLLPKPTTGFEGTSGLDYLAYIDENSATCDAIPTFTPGTRCRQSVAQVDPRIVVIGDSHGEHLFPGLLTEVTDVPSAYVYLEDWPSIVSEDSKEVPRIVAGLDSVDTVLLSARWNRVNVESPQLIETIEIFHDAGKEVVLLDDVPYFEFHAMECEFVRGLGPRPRCDMSARDYSGLQGEYVPQLQEVARRMSADWVPIGNVFCTADTCSMVKDGILQYADNGHVNVQGSRTLAQEILRALPIAN